MTYLRVGNVSFATKLVIEDLDLEVFKTRINGQLLLKRGLQSWPLRHWVTRIRNILDLVILAKERNRNLNLCENMGLRMQRLRFTGRA